MALITSSYGTPVLGPIAAILLAAAALSACGNQPGGSSMGGMDMGATSKSAKATLAPSNSLTGGGTVNVAVVKNQVHVDVRAQQLIAASKYTAHLHRGSCAAIGAIIKPIGELQTDNTGAGTVHLEYGGTDFPTPSFVDVHSADGTEGPAVCGDLR